MKSVDLNFRKFFLIITFLMSGFMFANPLLKIKSAVFSTLICIAVSCILIIFYCSISETFILKYSKSKFTLIFPLIFIAFSVLIIFKFSALLTLSNAFYENKLILYLVMAILLLISAYAAFCGYTVVEGVSAILLFFLFFFYIFSFFSFFETRAINIPNFSFNSAIIKDSFAGSFYIFGDSISLSYLILGNCENTASTKKTIYSTALISFLLLFINVLAISFLFGNELLLNINEVNLTITKLFPLFDIPEIYTFNLCCASFLKISVYLCASKEILIKIFPKISDKVIFIIGVLIYIIVLLFSIRL